MRLTSLCRSLASVSIAGLLQTRSKVLLEHQLESVAFPCVYTASKNYPREDAAHVALRTVRRFLEKFPDRVTAVVFALRSSSDMKIYEQLLPLYFPRNALEFERASLLIPEGLYDEWGEATSA